MTAKSVDPPELSSKEAIEAARKALNNKRDFRFGNLKSEVELMDLGLVTPNERIAAVDIALNEIGPQDRCGPNSPGQYFYLSLFWSHAVCIRLALLSFSHAYVYEVLFGWYYWHGTSRASFPTCE